MQCDTRLRSAAPGSDLGLTPKLPRCLLYISSGELDTFALHFERLRSSALSRRRNKRMPPLITRQLFRRLLIELGRIDVSKQLLSFCLVLLIAALA